MDGKKRMIPSSHSDAQGSADSNASPKTSRVSPPPSLTGMAVVERVFHFLDGPADVLHAATACRRWHELATADSVWRVKARREGMVEKAGVFEVALPAAAGGEGVGGGGSGDGGGSLSGGGASSSASSSAAAYDEEEDKELAGVGLAFYAQVFMLKVGLAWRGLRGRAFHSHHHRRSHPLPPIGRGTR